MAARTRKTASKTGARAARTKPPRLRTSKAAETERRAAQPAQASGPGSGTRLLGAPDEKGKQAEVAVTKLADPDADVIVTLREDVYEELPAPGAPNRMIQRLLYAKGSRVPKSVLDRHEAAQRKARETKDTPRGETKE